MFMSGIDSFGQIVAEVVVFSDSGQIMKKTKTRGSETAKTKYYKYM